MKYHPKPDFYPLELLMKKHGYTCRSFAKAIGLHYTYVSRLIKGHSITTHETYKKIQTFFRENHDERI